MIVTMDDVIRKVLSVGNKEQNQHYPPHIATEHFITVTNFLLDRIVELFPGNNAIVDIAKPFLEVKQVPVIVGQIAFPENYRNLLGASITVTKDKKNLCSGGTEYPRDPIRKTSTQIEKERLRGNCVSNDVIMVDQDEWNAKTMSKYKFPTYKKPMGCIFVGDGIRVCPYDIGTVELKYFRNPKEYNYGYMQLPDETYVPDMATTTESEWETPALQYLVKGMSSLYSVYLRDPEMRSWVAELKKTGLL